MPNKYRMYPTTNGEDPNKPKKPKAVKVPEKKGTFAGEGKKVKKKIKSRKAALAEIMDEM